MNRTLVLNATYEPLGVVTDRRALILVLNNRATMVESSGTVLHFATGQLELPSVVRLNKFVKIQLYIEPAKEYRRNALNVENVPCEIILESHPVTK